MITRKLMLAAGMAILLCASCTREEDASWETGLMAPLLRGHLDIGDIVADSLLQEEADSSLTLVYENRLYDMNIDSVFSLYDTSVTRTYKLDSISLYSQNISYPVSLGQVCANAGIVGALIISQNGNTIAVPPIPSISSAPFYINADTLFQTMTLVTGFMDIIIDNGFPIDMTNLTFEIENTSDGTVIATGNFPLISAGASAQQTISLAGKTVEGNMTAQILSMESPGSMGNLVLVDTSDVITATLSVYDLHPSTATAVFPAQDLVSKEQDFRFDNTVQLKEARLKSGSVVIDLYSTLQDSVYFTYDLPSATQGGVSFKVQKTLPPAPAGGVSSYSGTFDFSGYHLDLSGPNMDTVNTMYNKFVARVDSSGQMRTLSITDSLYANIGFVALNPSYVRGYLGMQEIDVGPDSEDITLFENLSGNFQLEKVNLSLVVENSIGADAVATITNFVSVNTNTGNQVAMTGPAINSPISISRATDQNGQLPVTPSIAAVQMDETNSNATAFISNLPDRVDYTMQIGTNPMGNVTNFHDFVYDGHLMEFNLNVEIPLSFIASDLELRGDFEFRLDEADIDRIRDGTLILLADNGFPLEAAITLYTLNGDGVTTDSLFRDALLAAAPVNAANKVVMPKRSRITIPVSEQRIGTLFETKRMLIRVKFNTRPSNTFLKIYSDYSIGFRLTGDFNYIAN